jgi:hypothetical protein
MTHETDIGIRPILMQDAVDKAGHLLENWDHRNMNGPLQEYADKLRRDARSALITVGALHTNLHWGVDRLCDAAELRDNRRFETVADTEAALAAIGVREIARDAERLGVQIPERVDAAFRLWAFRLWAFPAGDDHSRQAFDDVHAVLDLTLDRAVVATKAQS